MWWVVRWSVVVSRIEGGLLVGDAPSHLHSDFTSCLNTETADTCPASQVAS